MGMSDQPHESVLPDESVLKSYRSFVPDDVHASDGLRQASGDVINAFYESFVDDSSGVVNGIVAYGTNLRETCSCEGCALARCKDARPDG